jgi:hypothetical protein
MLPDYSTFPLIKLNIPYKTDEYFTAVSCIAKSIFTSNTGTLQRAGIAQSVSRLAMGWTTEGSEFASR